MLKGLESLSTNSDGDLLSGSKRGLAPGRAPDTNNIDTATDLVDTFTPTEPGVAASVYTASGNLASISSNGTLTQASNATGGGFPNPIPPNNPLPVITPGAPVYSSTTASQIAALGSKVADLTSSQISQLSPTAISGFTAAEIPFLSPSQISYLGTQETTKGIALVPSKLSSLTNAAIAALSPSQLASVNDLQLGDFSSSQIASLSDSAIAALTGAQVTFLAANISALSAAQLQALTPAAIGGLRAPAIAALSNAQLAALTNDGEALSLLSSDNTAYPTGAPGYEFSGLYGLTAAQIQSLPPSALASLSGTQLSALSPNGVSGLTASQIAEIGTSISAFSATQVASISPSILGSLTSAQIQSLGSSVAGFTTEQIAALNASQVAVFTGSQINALTTDQIVALSTSQAASWNSEQLDSINTDALDNLTADQIADLAPPVFRVLPPTLQNPNPAETPPTPAGYTYLGPSTDSYGNNVYTFLNNSNSTTLIQTFDQSGNLLNQTYYTINPNATVTQTSANFYPGGGFSVSTSGDSGTAFSAYDPNDGYEVGFVSGNTTTVHLFDTSGNGLGTITMTSSSSLAESVLDGVEWGAENNDAIQSGLQPGEEGGITGLVVGAILGAVSGVSPVTISVDSSAVSGSVTITPSLIGDGIHMDYQGTLSFADGSIMNISTGADAVANFDYYDDPSDTEFVVQLNQNTGVQTITATESDGTVWTLNDDGSWSYQYTQTNPPQAVPGPPPDGNTPIPDGAVPPVLPVPLGGPISDAGTDDDEENEDADGLTELLESAPDNVDGSLAEDVQDAVNPIASDPFAGDPIDGDPPVDGSDPETSVLQIPWGPHPPGWR